MGLGLDELGALDAAEWVPSLPLLASSVALLLSAYFVSGALWGRVVSDLGGPRLGVIDAIGIFMIANLARYVPGKVWQIASLAALAKARGVSATTAMGAAVLGQGIALAAATLVGLAGLLSAGAPGWGLAPAIAIASGAALVAVPPVFRRLTRLLFRLARSPVPEGLRSTHGVRWLALFGLNWVLYAFSFWVLVVSFGAEAALAPVASAFAAAYVLGYAAIFAPAGLGVREGFLVALLAPHLGVAHAGAFAVIARVWTTVVELVPAVAFWIRHVSAAGAGGEGEVAGE